MNVRRTVITAVVAVLALVPVIGLAQTGPGQEIEGGKAMSEFLQSYGFFILIAALMLACHLFHVGGQRGGKEDDPHRPSAGHQH